MADLGPILSSIMGSQEREFAHQSSMQSASLSAQRSMQSASLANALKIASMNNKTQRYGIDVGAETTRRGQDIGKEVAFRGQDFDLMAKRWTNALNYLSVAAQLKGPADWLSYLNFSRGAANQGAPAFLASLMGEGGVQDFGRLGPDRPLPASLAGIAADLGYTGGGQAAPNGSGGLSPQQQGTINSVAAIANNFHQLQPGALENLSQDEQQFLLGTANSLGYSIPTLLNTYAQAGIGQGSARAA